MAEEKPAIQFKGGVTISVISFNSDVEAARLEKNFETQVTPEIMRDMVKEFNSPLPDVRIYQHQYLRLLPPPPKKKPRQKLISLNPKKK